MKKGMSQLAGIILAILAILLFAAFLSMALSKTTILAESKLKILDQPLAGLMEIDGNEKIVCGPNAPEEVKAQFKDVVRSMNAPKGARVCIAAVPFAKTDIFKAGSKDTGYVIGIKTSGENRLITLLEKGTNRMVCQAFQYGQEACIVNADSANSIYADCLSTTALTPGETCNTILTPYTPADYIIWDGGNKAEVYFEKVDVQKKGKAQDFTMDLVKLDTNILTAAPKFLSTHDADKTLLLLNVRGNTCFIGKPSSMLSKIVGVSNDDIAKKFIDKFGKDAICGNCAYQTCASFDKTENECRFTSYAQCGFDCIPSYQGSAFTSCTDCTEVTSCRQYTTNAQCDKPLCSITSCTSKVDAQGNFVTCLDCKDVTSCPLYGSEGACLNNVCLVSGNCMPKYGSDKVTYAGCEQCDKSRQCSQYHELGCEKDLCHLGCYPKYAVDQAGLVQFSSCEACGKSCADVPKESCNDEALMSRCWLMCWYDEATSTCKDK